MCPSETHDPFPRSACAVRVLSNREIAPAIFELVTDRTPETDSRPAGTHAPSGIKVPSGTKVPAPVPGQFFMLRARPSGVLLGRPISVYLSDERTLSFLVLKKGRGTAELCALREGDTLDLVGPIGNRFIPPAELDFTVKVAADGPVFATTKVAETHVAESGNLSSAGAAGNAAATGTTGNAGAAGNAAATGTIGTTGKALRVAIVGGGIGVAPVAGFALGLPPKSFDFYASFRSGTYGLHGIESRADRLFVTTEDGSAGVKGMLPAVFDPSRYDLVYACGPTPMLRYIKKACDDARVRAFISLEEHMACGAGACLGCTVKTVNGNRRCCVDGPVFDSSEVLL